MFIYLTVALVTGGAGFIGSNLVDLLLEEGYTLKVLDNLSTGKEINLTSKVELIKGDITNSEDIANAVKNVSVIFHLAAQASVAVSMKKPLLDAKVNTLGTLALLKEAHQKEVDQFVFSSTGGAIYGEPETVPVPESHPEHPVSVYGTSKLAAEKYIKFYQGQGLNSSILRFANVYGPRQDPFGEAGVISIFLNAVKEKKPLQVFGDGSSSRDYVFVKDVARAAIDISKKQFAAPLNLGSGKEIGMNELIDVIKEVVGEKIEVNYGPKRAGDVEKIFLDSSALEKHLGWKAETSLLEGMKEVWKWMTNK